MRVQQKEVGMPNIIGISITIQEVLLECHPKTRLVGTATSKNRTGVTHPHQVPRRRRPPTIEDVVIHRFLDMSLVSFLFHAAETIPVITATRMVPNIIDVHQTGVIAIGGGDRGLLEILSHLVHLPLDAMTQ